MATEPMTAPPCVSACFDSDNISGHRPTARAALIPAVTASLRRQRGVSTLTAATALLVHYRPSQRLPWPPPP